MSNFNKSSTDLFKTEDVIDLIYSVKTNGMYITLSEEDYAVIKDDIELFRTNKDAENNRYKYTEKQFIKLVFMNMYEKTVYKERSKTDSKGGSVRKKTAAKYNIKPNKGMMDIMLEKVVTPLKKNDKNCKIYPPDCAAFFIQVIAEYCKMSLIERERIFYKRLISDLNDEIELKYLLKLKKNDGKDGKRNSFFLPYKIKKSDDVHKNYITGFALSKTNAGYIYDKTLCVPINRIFSYQRIERIRPEKDISFKKDSGIQSYADMKDYIEERFRTDGVLYLSDILRDVTVRLTDNGKEFFLSRTQHRPVYEFDKNDDHLVRCRATQLQTFMYFFKFGGDAEILEPEDYRGFFEKKYKEAYLVYNG